MLDMSCPFPTDKDDGSEVFNVMSGFWDVLRLPNSSWTPLRELSAGRFQVGTVV